MKPLDIVAHINLFGEWEITTAQNFFATEMALTEIAYIPVTTFPTFEQLQAHLALVCERNADTIHRL